MNIKNKLSVRWLYLTVSTVSMLFAGIIYAWSVLKVPIADALSLDISASKLTLNFTLTMCCFCIGGFLGSIIIKKTKPSVLIIISGALAGLGFVLTSLCSSGIALLYISYAVMAGLGIGASYNIIISTVNKWFPDKMGLCSGCMLMGFGVSTLLFGKVFEAMFQSIGWRSAYILFGIAIAVVLCITGLVLKLPPEGMQFPSPKQKKSAQAENFEAKDYTALEMVKRFSFWRAFLFIAFIGAVGNSVINFARDLVISIGVQASFASTLVGILSVFNGIGRIITGSCFDTFGRKTTMLFANILAIIAAGLTLVSIITNSVVLCIIGLCLIGLSYGTTPTLCSSFTAAFYGKKHFATNYSIMIFTLIAASAIATACSALFNSCGTYIVPFILLCALTLVSLILSFSIRRP